MLKYDNDKQLEYSLITLHKTIEKGINIQDLATLFFLLLKIFSEKPLQVWKAQITQNNFMKILGVLFVCVERLNNSGSNKDLPVVYKLFEGKSEKNIHPILTLENNHKFYLWLWEAKFDSINEVVDIIKQYPVFYRDIPILNILSKKLNISNFDKLGEETEDGKNILLFFNTLSVNFKRLVELMTKKVKGYELIQKSDSKILNSNRSLMIEFLDRVSRSNSQETKSFLVALMKSLGQIYDGNIETLLLGEMAHLYRDSFSF